MMKNRSDRTRQANYYATSTAPNPMPPTVSQAGAHHDADHVPRNPVANAGRNVRTDRARPSTKNQ
jgi:hypothetical protein